MLKVVIFLGTYLFTCTPTTLDAPVKTMMASGLFSEYDTSWNRWMDEPRYLLISDSIVFNYYYLPPTLHKKWCIIHVNCDTVYYLQNTWSTFMINCIRSILLQVINATADCYLVQWKWHFANGALLITSEPLPHLS